MPTSTYLDENAAPIAIGGGLGTMIRWAGDVDIPKEWVHPDWLKRHDDWRYFRLCYVGGSEFLKSRRPRMLHSHAREDQESYDDRQRRAYYRNHSKAIVGLKADAIYQPQVLRNQSRAAPQRPDEDPPIKRAQSEDPAFDAWLKDVDLKGTNADPWWNEVARWSMVYGTQWVGIAKTDAPPALKALAARRPLVEAEARQANVRTFLYTCSPLSVVNWSCNERGQLEFVVVLAQECARVPMPGQGEKQPKPRLVARVLYTDREERFEIGKRGAMKSLGVTPHNFGAVPLVPVMVRADGLSEIEDISRINVDLFNNDSMITEQISRQTFNQMRAKVKDSSAFMDNVTGTDALICVAPDEDVDYFSNNVQTIAAIRERCAELEDSMWSMANLRSRPGAKGSQPAVDVSGVAYAFEHKNAETDLSSIADRLEEAELKIGQMRARALALDPEGFTCAYPNEFDIRALLARANEAKELLAVDLGKTAAAEIRKNLVRKALPRLPAGRLYEIDGEIEAIAPAPAPTPPGQPPNQSMQPPGAGAGEDRMERMAKGAPAHRVGQMVEVK